jgi:hypothetical protein
MAKQTFTVGQVLTAAQLTSLQQTAMGGGAASAKTASYTLVAADAGTTISMTSTSATTITVNQNLFAAGDTVFIQNLGSGNLTITAGTATVATAGSLILPQNDAGILYFVSTSSSVFYDFIQVGAASPLTTKGDIYGFSTSDARIPIGANGTILTADSTESLGLKWATPAAAGANFTLLNSGGTALTGAATITVSGISGKDKLAILIDNSSSVNTNFTLSVRFNTDSGTNYSRFGLYLQSTTSQQNEQSSFADDRIYMASSGTSSPGSVVAGYVMVDGCNAAGVKRWWMIAGGNGTAAVTYPSGGVYQGSSTISSVSVLSSNGNFDGGTVYIYGSA